VAVWIPRTELGKKVRAGEITTFSEAYHSGLGIKEAQIVDALITDMRDEVLDVNMVQRMTDSGRRLKFAITVVVGNGDGVVGLGRSKGREVGPAIRTAIERAKLNLVEVLRGCGSWECGCYRPHSLPFAVTGKCGSVRVTFKPAPRGVGLAVGDIAKPVLRFAGIQDAWGFTEGHTKTTVNYAMAAFDAMAKLSLLKVPQVDLNRLKMVRGMTGTTILPKLEATEEGSRGGPRGRGRGRGGPGRGGPGRGGPGRGGPGRGPGGARPPPRPAGGA
jgi:small subunit ribosomal protein S5